MFRQIYPGDNVDKVTPESVAHLKKKVTQCWNYSHDPELGKTSHELKLKKVIDRSQANKKDGCYVIKEMCEHCGTLYSQVVVPVTRTDLFEEYGIKP